MERIVKHSPKKTYIYKKSTLSLSQKCNKNELSEETVIAGELRKIYIYTLLVGRLTGSVSIEISIDFLNY